LSTHELLILPVSGHSSRFSRWKNEDGIYIGELARFVIDDVFTIRDLALSGAGIAVMPEYVAAEALRSGCLVRIMPNMETLKLPVHLLHTNHHYMPHRLRVVLDTLSAQRFP
jgi:DNA-binding transcriptional LysR family regulator